MNEIFILGSGFSKAINENMPLTNNLKKDIETKIKSTNTYMNWEIYNSLSKNITDFEELISLLFQNFPWKSEEEQSHFYSIFLTFSKFLAILIKEKQESYDYENNPFLEKFINYLRKNQSIIITFNYDTILETAASPTLGPIMSPNEYYKMPITKLINRVASGGTAKFGEDIFRLLKLHGSINWYYSGKILNQPAQVYLEIGHHWKEDEEIAKKDLCPLIIPPVFDKTGFMNLNFINVIWRDAKKYLRNSNRIYIIGYSVPDADLNIKLMLKTCVKKDAEIFLVNTDKSIIRRVRNIFKNPEIKINKEFVSEDKDIVKKFIEFKCT